MADKTEALVPAGQEEEPLKRVNLYIATSVMGPGRRKGSCGYVLECPDRPPSAKNPMAEIMYIGETTAHGSLLSALREALGHVRSRCILTVYTDSPYIAAALSEYLPEWEKRDFMTKKEKPVADRENWKETAVLLNAAGCPVSVRLKAEHEWRNWLSWELEKQTSEGVKCDKD